MPNRNREAYWRDKLFSLLNLSITGDVVIRERPDICITCGDSEIGIEITECAPEEFFRGEKAIKDFFKKNPLVPVVYSLGAFKESSERRKTSTIVEDAVGNINFTDMEEDRLNWQKKVLSVIKHKTEKLNSKDFKRYNQNWLLIGDSLGSWEDCSSYKYFPELCEDFTINCGGETKFDLIYILTGKFSVQISLSGVRVGHPNSQIVNKYSSSVAVEQDTAS